MRTLVVGDLHGNLELYKKIMSNKIKRDLTVLTGDLLDSYIFEPKEQIKLVEEVIGDIENGNTKCLIGNHEASYVYGSRCSGFNRITYDLLIKGKTSENLFGKILSKFSLFLMVDDFIVTHAGISSRFVHKYIKGNDIESIATYLSEIEKIHFKLAAPAFKAGYARGGSDAIPGILWCDFNEEFVPVAGVKQIFGHTPGQTIREYIDSDGKGTNNWCIDCLPSITSEKSRVPVGLLVENGVATVVNLIEKG